MRRCVLSVLLAGLVLPGTAAAKVFSGLLQAEPSLQHPGGVVRSDGDATLAEEMFGQGFDVNPRVLVWADFRSGELVVRSADGTSRRVRPSGLHAIARPSLSPDGTEVVVQATETPVAPGSPPQNLTVYAVNLSSGAFRRLVPPPADPGNGNEVPEWLPGGNAVAYRGAEGECQVVAIVDATSGAERLRIRAGGTSGCFQSSSATGPRFHLTANHDGSRLLVVGQMQTYDSQTGALVSDVRARVLEGLAAAGFAPDNRFPGQGNGGTFPLDGSISYDGQSIYLDGAVRRVSDGATGFVVARVAADGSGFELVKGPYPFEPMFTNGANFSQINPVLVPFFGGSVHARKAISVRRGRTVRLPVTVTNDGDGSDTFAMTYAAKGVGVTGPRSTGALQPDTTKPLIARITAGRRARLRTVKVTIRATSAKSGEARSSVVLVRTKP